MVEVVVAMQCGRQILGGDVGRIRQKGHTTEPLSSADKMREAYKSAFSSGGILVETGPASACGCPRITKSQVLEVNLGTLACVHYHACMHVSTTLHKYGVQITDPYHI